MAELNEKSAGLLIRMSFHRVCCCSKRFQLPLLRRGFVKQDRKGVFSITKDGRKEAKRLAEKYAGNQLETYTGVSIGTEVMMLSSGQ